MDNHVANWDHCLEYASLSDVGLRRANNQDAMAVVLAGALSPSGEQTADTQVWTPSLGST